MDMKKQTGDHMKETVLLYGFKDQERLKKVKRALLPLGLRMRTVGPVSYTHLVYVTAGNLNCREGKSTDSAVLGTVPRGTKIQRESDDGTWSRVTVNGNACYVASRYLSSQEPSSVLDGKSAVQVHERNVQVESSKDVFLDKNWEFASFSKINSEAAVYYNCLLHTSVCRYLLYNGKRLAGKDQ